MRLSRVGGFCTCNRAYRDDTDVSDELLCSNPRHGVSYPQRAPVPARMCFGVPPQVAFSWQVPPIGRAGFHIPARIFSKFDTSAGVREKYRTIFCEGALTLVVRPDTPSMTVRKRSRIGNIEHCGEVTW